MIAGAIPGFTIAMAVILTLPFTFAMPPNRDFLLVLSLPDAAAPAMALAESVTPCTTCWKWILMPLYYE